MNKRRLITTLKVTTPFILGGAILYWMFRNFDFKSMERVLCEEMNWWWMLLSFPFGILAQAFRGWRWKQALEPVGENPRTSTTIYSIFISYAASLAVPRIGEFTRCSRTGTRFDEIFGMFTTTGYIVTTICGVAVLISLYSVRKKLSFYDKVKATLHGVIEGVMSLRGVKNIPLFLFYSIAIWASYFLHYYLTFFCFSGTAHLGITCAMVTFIVGSIAVLVPTPNGAGPWHFAVKTMLILYGVADNEALYFVLIVHTVQTLLVIAIGVYAWAALAFKERRLRDDLESK